MEGLTMYIWHEGRSRYDEAQWFPGPVAEEDARGLAQLRLQADTRATHVQLEFDDRFIAVHRETVDRQ